MSYSTRWLMCGFLVVGGILAIVAGFFTLPSDARIGVGAILVGIGLLAPAAWWLRHASRGKRVPRTRSISSIGVLAVATGLVLFPWSNLSLADNGETDPKLQQAGERTRTSVPRESRGFHSSTSSSATSEESATLVPSTPRHTSPLTGQEPLPMEPEVPIVPESDVAPSPANFPTPVPPQPLPQLTAQTSEQRLPQLVVPSPSQPATSSPSESVSPSPSESPQTLMDESSPSESTEADQSTPASTESEQPNDVNEQRAEESEENGGPVEGGDWRFDPPHLIPWLP